MHSPPDGVGEGIRFTWCPSIRSFVRPFGQILLPQYLMYGLSNLSETYREYSVAPSDDLIRFQRSKVTAGLRGGEGSHVVEIHPILYSLFRSFMHVITVVLVLRLLWYHCDCSRVRLSRAFNKPLACLLTITGRCAKTNWSSSSRVACRWSRPSGPSRSRGCRTSAGNTCLCCRISSRKSSGRCWTTSPITSTSGSAGSTPTRRSRWSIRNSTRNCPGFIGSCCCDASASTASTAPSQTTSAASWETGGHRIHVKLSVYTRCLKNNFPDIFSCNLSKHFPIWITFGTSVT